MKLCRPVKLKAAWASVGYNPEGRGHRRKKAPAGTPGRDDVRRFLADNPVLLSEAVSKCGRERPQHVAREMLQDVFECMPHLDRKRDSKDVFKQCLCLAYDGLRE